ncbi:anti-phage dCTP deaminase [Marinospirillum insulare]|nr:anti-phage dCTP deaminase [Marinospirillum insulare]
MGVKKEVIATDTSSNQNSTELLSQLKSNEKFVAVVGPAGAGSGTAAKILASILQGEGYETEIIKVSVLINDFVASKGKAAPRAAGHKNIDDVTTMQDLGDSIRKGEEYELKEDHAAVARLVIKKIKELRETKQSSVDISPVENDANRAFIIDSLRHPAEAVLLREVYKELFTLIGVVCNPEERSKRIKSKLIPRGSGKKEELTRKVEDYMSRDENAKENYGQKVAKLFYEADYFVDNSEEGNDDVTETGMNEPLQRLVSIIAHNKIVRPTTHEAAMYQAHAAQMQSACLSRQVGAALVDKNHNVVAVGLNDVPKAGGGLYGQGFNTSIERDSRCAYRGSSPFCSSNVEQNAIIDELISEFPELVPDASKKEKVIGKIRGTRIGGLIEFSRAVHAEMNAIISAAISGVSPKGCRLYVSTYPCHYCARHIVTAGIDEVQFIEPYPKSKATELHNDSITTELNTDWKPPSEGGDKVLFRPFVGVAPRFYKLAFLKDRDYKNKKTGMLNFGTPEPGMTSTVYTQSYPELEEKLTEGF